MRALFIAPLATPRITGPIGELADGLLALGCEVQVLLRTSTRVRSDTGLALSRNENSASALRERIGFDRIGLLHGHLTRQTSGHDMDVDTIDQRRVSHWLNTFVPDLVVLAGLDMLERDPVFAPLREPKARWNAYTLHCGPARRHWHLQKLQGGTRFLDSAKPAELRKLLTQSLSALPNLASSQEALRKVLSREAATLDALVEPVTANASAGVHLTPAVPRVAPAAGFAATPLHSSEIKGELESIRDGEVVFGSHLWVKGWIDWNPAAQLRQMRVLVNDHTYPLMLGHIRGDVAERLQLPDAVSFEARVPLNASGPVLNVGISLTHKDGTETPWQQRVLFTNDCIPERHQIPIALGHARLEVAPVAESAHPPHCEVVGGVVIAEHAVTCVSVYQRGQRIGELRPPEQGTSPLQFRIALDPAHDPGLPVEVWLDSPHAGRIHWLRCAPTRRDSRAAGWSITGLADWETVEGDVIRFSVGPLPDMRPPAVFVNGQACEPVDVRPDTDHNIAMTVPVAGSGNDLHLVLELDGAQRTLRLWRHLEVPASALSGTAVAVPETSTLASGRALSADGPAKVLVLRKVAAPTDELYLLAPLRELEASGAVRLDVVDMDAEVNHPVDTSAMLTPGTTVLVSRYITPRWLSEISRRKASLGRVFYLMDDDVSVAIDSPNLPASYRQRMTRVACGEFQSMIRLCDRFLVTSRHLQARYASLKTDLLEPPCLHSPRDLRHLADERNIVITYQGTEGHRDDIAAISPALRSIHDLFPCVTLRLIVGTAKAVPPLLKGLPRCEVIPPMSWPDYKAFRAKDRAHIALAPILDTPYNRGKSTIKLFDISALGAVGLYTNSAPYDAVVQHNVNGLLLDNDPQLWFKALKWLIQRPGEIRRLAEGGQALANETGSVAHLRDYWHQHLAQEQVHV